MRYELAYDEPNYDDENLIVPKCMKISSEEYEQYINKMKNNHCSKIGGYASSIQSYPFSEVTEGKPKFCLQIDTELKVGLMWGDSGTFYVARVTAPRFKDRSFVDCQFY